MSLYSDTFYSDDINQLFSEKSYLRQMLRVEAALVTAQASVGIVPQEAAEIVAASCNINFLLIDKIKSEIKDGGNAAIPLVRQLTRIVKNTNFEASKYVHLGATSQDIIDTATILSIREYTTWLEGKLDLLIAELQSITKKHRNSLMIGRTLMQQARPITFGLKTAGWLQSIRRSRVRLRETQKRIYAIQLAGAVGAGNESLSQNVQKKLAEILGLEVGHPWQSQRDNLNELACVLGILNGSMGKIARDVSLMMQTEVAEVFEGAAEGKGGSSTMPHKRNPVGCALILANSQRTPHLVSTLLSTMIQEHERSAGFWHAEWETLTQLMELTAGSVEKSIDLILNLEVDTDRMVRNIALTKGLIFAENVSLSLSKTMGKGQAHEFVEKICKKAIAEDRPLLDCLRETDIDLPNLDELFKPENSMGNSLEIIDSILEETAHSL